MLQLLCLTTAIFQKDEDMGRSAVKAVGTQGNFFRWGELVRPPSSPLAQLPAAAV
jgi:hypothetical protein